jgi:probable HAF family extracellular repeat protein
MMVAHSTRLRRRGMATIIAAVMFTALAVAPVPVWAQEPATSQGFTGGGRGFLREPDGEFVPVNVPGATGTFPLDINNHGQIVGAYDDADGVTHGFLLSAGRFVTIDHPDATGVFNGLAGTVVLGINDRKQLVGTYVASDNLLHGFLLDRGRFIPIEGPGAVTTILVDINNRGQIIVQASNPDGSLPQYLLERGVFTPIAFPSAADTVAHKINPRGQVAGGYVDSAGTQHGFVLDRGRYTSIDVDVPGSVGTVLNQSNARGDVVGYSIRSLDLSDAVAFVMRRGGTITTFDVPEAATSTASAINERGQIVGAGFPASTPPASASR